MSNLLLLFSIIQTQEVLDPSDIAPLQAQGLNETGEGSYGDVAISLEEILQEPVSNVSLENIGEPVEQNAVDDHFSLEDLAGYPRQDGGYADQDEPIIWSDPSNDEQAYWPLRTYGTQIQANGTLGAEEFFDMNDTNAYSGQHQACPSEDQNIYLQTNGLPGSQQLDDNMAFHDASNNLKWENEDYLNVNGLIYPPNDNDSLLDVEDLNLLDYFDTTEDLKFDILDSDLPNFAQKVCFITKTILCYFSLLKAKMSRLAKEPFDGDHCGATLAG
jgi:hypothetical protein